MIHKSEGLHDCVPEIFLLKWALGSGNEWDR